jgi:hypothetical protein
VRMRCHCGATLVHITRPHGDASFDGSYLDSFQNPASVKPCRHLMSISASLLPETAFG